MVQSARHEILTLESQGWNVSELTLLAEEDPKEFIRQLSSSRSAMSNISKIQRRLSALDWRRDVTKGLEISEMVRNPISLKGIETQIPALIRHLSSRPIEEEEFRYPLWSPTQRPVLIPQNETRHPMMKPVITPPQTTLEDAQEAILEAMEEQVETLESPEMASKEEEKAKTQPKRIEKKAQEEPIPKPVEIKQSSADGQPNPRLLRSFQTILERLALSHSMVFNAQGTLDTKHLRRTLAEHVGIEPRDVRVDRMIRLLLRLLPSDDSSNDQRSVMIDKIGEALPKYQQWIRMRLEARHSGASGNFLEDSIQLGAALERTPGPGVKVPLSADTTPLPDSSNLQDLEKSVQRLVEALDLNTAGGVN